MKKGIVLGLVMVLGLVVVLRWALESDQVSSQEQDLQLTFTPHYSVGEAEAPPEELFGRIQHVALSKEGILYIGEEGAQEVRVFDATGTYVATMGGRGQGPGEFEDMRDLTLSVQGDSLYVFSGPRHISVFSTASHRFVRRFTGDFTMQWVHIYALPANEMLITGAKIRDEENKTMHIHDLNGGPLRDFGTLLNITEPDYNNLMLRVNLNVGHATLMSNNDLVVSLQMPYHLARFSIEGEERWRIHDDVVPDPWDGYMDQRGSIIGALHLILDVHALNDQYVMVVHGDREDEKSYYDIRDASDGRLVARHEIPYRQSIPALVSLGDKEGLAVIKTVDPFPKFTVMRWTLE